MRDIVTATFTTCVGSSQSSNFDRSPGAPRTPTSLLTGAPSFQACATCKPEGSTRFVCFLVRMEDVTDPELLRQNAKCDRNVCLYGYVRGTHFKNDSHLHIPGKQKVIFLFFFICIQLVSLLAGAGDFRVSDVSLLPDPCPLPDAEKRRSLNDRERPVYAPFSGVGGIVYDKDAVYIDLGPNHPLRPQGSDVKPVLS